MSTDRPALIEQRLRASLTIETIEVIDDSHLHRGHPGARAGGGHYRVHVVSPDFAGKGTVARHRMVYEAMGDAMRNDVIHALSIRARTPAEATADAGEG